MGSLNGWSAVASARAHVVGLPLFQKAEELRF